MQAGCSIYSLWSFPGNFLCAENIFEQTDQSGIINDDKVERSCDKNRHLFILEKYYPAQTEHIEKDLEQKKYAESHCWNKDIRNEQSNHKKE